MTPTPAFPRPRARFDLPPPPDDLLQTPAPRNNFTENEDLVTPHTRRRSFLLSVINSTARPRIKMGTPHPHKLAPVTPSVAGSTPRTESGESASTASSGSGSAAAPAVRAPFPNVGLTPRPKAQVGRRLSHPLSQAISASSSGSNRKPWGTPAHLNSPYDGANDKASFVSTASSHDLTTHHRVNTSFDPSMGFGSAAQGHGVGRFNANKLNNYLHSLNRRLQEENENLLARMRDMEEEKFVALEVNETGSADGTSSRRSSGVHRRLSVGGALGNVQEDIAEAWLEEKAELEEMVEGFKDEAEKYLLEKEELEKQLELEKEERKRDQERWEDRMREAEQGIEVILTDLNKKLGAAQSKADKTEERAAQQIQQAERDVEEMRNELDVALDRATKAERLLESGKDLGGALKEANDRVVQVMNDLRNSNAQIKELEREVIRADHRIEDLEKDLREDKDIISNLEADLAAEAGILKQEREKAKTLEAAVHDLENEVDSTKEYVTELEEGAGIAMEQIEKLESDLSQAHSTIEAMNAAKEDSFKMIKDLEADLERLRDLNRQLEDAIDETEKKNSEDDEHINELQSKISSLERERDKFRQLADNAREPSVKLDSGPTEEDLEALEKELDDAHKEIARLSTLLSQSPARKAMDMARDTKLEMLEREKEELLERNKALRMTLNEFQTPHKVNNSTMISPIHRHVLNLSMKAPRTPGAPLRDMSWLNSTMNDPSVSPLIAEIHRLQQELEVANESIDDKLDKLEDAGMGVVGLTKKLEDARARISRLEDEVARLSRKEDRFVRRLSRTRCKKCNVKVDMSRVIADESSMDASPDSMMSEPPTPPTRTTEALKAQLQAANASLEHLREEMEELQADNKRLGGQIRNAKAEVRKVADGRKAGDKARNGIETELDRAKQTISHLEDALANERSKLRALSAEHDKAEKEKKHVLNDMQRTESDMEDVKDQLQKLKRENQELEKELRQNSTAEQKARLLETKVAENLDTIAQLRNERSLLSSDHKELQRRYSALSETVSRIREERAVHSTSHDVRKHKLDLQVLEIEELKQALESRSEQLHRAKQEKERIASEKSDVARTVASLEADLRRVRRDAEAFGHDLKILRAEKESLEAKLKEEAINGERTKKQSSTQVKLLNEQVESQKRKLAKALQEFEDHACTSDEHQVSTLKLQHNKECKGLMVQIRYLKAKYTRESSFRSDLTYQKDYLLVLLKQFEKSERNIVASIARIGFPAAPSRPKHGRKLKSVAIVVVFLNRTRKGKDEWKQQTAARASIQAALEDVRRRRALPSSSS
ncbi:hypothetical protein FA15DRAFT_581743 [Coprinopsis marcescibilis]|uniref:Pericentrin/AKAP-450 centrosomal targeting domain-containing protein n=1 Tax=Coprinopsis marcescibilis TaxID=230819 RepID=A0A5C3LAD1_COPMA|nr:hypothetical protein FA15DRAFT_581743 [Coprinopsis marcescibilis]